MTVPEVRRLLWGLVWGHMPTNNQVWAWSLWRRHHQARARYWHYKKRLQQQDAYLQL